MVENGTSFSEILYIPSLGSRCTNEPRLNIFIWQIYSANNPYTTDNKELNKSSVVPQC